VSVERYAQNEATPKAATRNRWSFLKLEVKMFPNVAVVGTGYWGQNLMRNFAELGALRTVCDANSLAEAKADAQGHW